MRFSNPIAKRLRNRTGSVEGLGATLVLLAAMFLNSCIAIPHPSFQIEGRESIDEELTAFVVPGLTTRRDILMKLGEPDFATPDGRRILYYWKKTRWSVTVAFYRSGSYTNDLIVDRGCLVFTFDSAGRAATMTREDPSMERLKELLSIEHPPDLARVP